MNPVRNISTGELSPKARQLLEAVRRGETVLVEDEGQPEAALLDIVDYRILRAVMHAYATPSTVDPEKGLPNRAVVAEPGQQKRYDQVLAHYLEGAISLSRAAELLELAPSALRNRFNRLEVPQRMAPASAEEAKQDVDTSLNWRDVS